MNNIVMKESYELCPYLRELQRESRRNAIIRDGDRYEDDEFSMDIPEAERIMSRVKAHLSRRVERQTKNKWVSLASEYASELSVSGPIEKEQIRRYLQMARDNIDAFGKGPRKGKRKGKTWVRTKKPDFDVI